MYFPPVARERVGIDTTSLRKICSSEYLPLSHRAQAWEMKRTSDYLGVDIKKRKREWSNGLERGEKRVMLSMLLLAFF